MARMGFILIRNSSDSIDFLPPRPRNAVYKNPPNPPLASLFAKNHQTLAATESEPISPEEDVTKARAWS
jgi:hypothetical protein